MKHHHEKYPTGMPALRAACGALHSQPGHVVVFEWSAVDCALCLSRSPLEDEHKPLTDLQRELAKAVTEIIAPKLSPTFSPLDAVEVTLVVACMFMHKAAEVARVPRDEAKKDFLELAEGVWDGFIESMDEPSIVN